MRKLLLTFVLALTLCVPSLAAETWNVGTWKTAQTIQPFLYEPFANGATVKVHPFTNPGDQKAALLAGSLDMTGTTLALAIQAASRGEPIVLVASLGNKCSALVVKKGGVKSVGDLEGKKIGYVPGTMHEILLRETLTRAGLNPDKDAKLVRIDFFGATLTPTCPANLCPRWRSGKATGRFWPIRIMVKASGLSTAV